MSISIADHSTLLTDGSGSAGTNLTWTTTVSAGQMLVGAACGFGGAFVAGDVTDNRNGRTYNVDAGTGVSNGDRLAVWWLTNCAAGSTTIKLSTATVTFPIVYFWLIDCKSNAIVKSVAVANGSSTSPTSNTITPPTLAFDNISLGVMTHNVGDVTISAGTGWTLDAKQENYSGPVQPGAMIHKTSSDNSTMAPTWSLSGSPNWSVIGIEICNPPQYQYASAIIDAQQSFSISFDWPVISGSVVSFGLVDYALDPTTTGLSDDGSNTWALDAQQTFGGGGSLDGSLTGFRSNITNQMQTITFDSGIVPGPDTPGTWFDAAILAWGPADAVASPFDTSNTDLGNATNLDGGSCTSSTSRTLDILMLTNRGHATNPVTLPAGYTIVINNSENSAHLAGHYCFKELSGIQTTNPTATRGVNDNWRGLHMMYKLAGGSGPTVTFFAFVDRMDIDEHIDVVSY